MKTRMKIEREKRRNRKEKIENRRIPRYTNKYLN
jgi:hypothetical protein